MEYGDVVISAPREAPSSKNCTPATETLSDAAAETVVRLAMVPWAGDVMDTVGGVVSLTPPEPARISTTLRLYRSVVGAVSLMVTLVPLAETALVNICDQYVSPVGVKY
jgi:hypothetical protein